MGKKFFEDLFSCPVRLLHLDRQIFALDEHQLSSLRDPEMHLKSADFACEGDLEVIHDQFCLLEVSLIILQIR